MPDIGNLLDENAAHAQYIIGNRYYLTGEYERAIDELMRVTILYKNVKSFEEWSARAKLLMARCNISLDKKDEAEKNLEEVLELHSRDELGAEAKRILEGIR